ncbi:GNAT family N-acetyltransferase [Marinobacterium sp. LSUCC0821]|uniref:GNAT family N-acetyltransferase n=1 Tax=Marinobacterium sp. LSUCC0821 TaxID=2668067 RepID=UPI00145277EA|nr:GNAT family N-acetyltransferase [Marinobacterium sp. LSUCC0821]QJD72162.1 GNAT family N-acetyltransferase [Marinobacterium sp. LSUCC0821]
MIYKLNHSYYVRPFRESDVEGPYLSWFEDQDVCKFNGHGKFFKSEASMRKFAAEANNDRQLVWAICHVDDGHIGNISLQNISFIDRTAEFAILMGDQRHWGKGVARLAGKVLLYHGFFKLNLERVYCGTAATNEGMKKLAVQLGMAHEGTRRAHLYLEGERVDIVEYGILKSEYSGICTE